MRISKPAYAATILAITLCHPSLWAQGPSGNDISEAIPIYFGQKVQDLGDSSLIPHRVYKLTLARGQSITVTATYSAAECGNIYLLAPTATSVKSFTPAQNLAEDDINCRTAGSYTYQSVAAGTYFIYLFFETGKGITYTLQVTATGTPIAVPNPQSAGCLSGKVDSITYSLQYIALGLPDEVTIGGTRACTTCATKPPLYPEISSRLESAMNSGGNVEACFDASGNIFQLKLLRP